MFFEEIRCSIETRFTRPVSTNQLKQLRPTISAVKSEARMPSVSEIANPLTGPLAFQNKNRGRDQGGDVSVEDRAEGFFVGGLDARS